MYALSGGANASAARHTTLPSLPASAYKYWSWLAINTVPSAPTAGELDTAPPVADAHTTAADDGPANALRPEWKLSAPRHGHGGAAGPLAVNALLVAVALPSQALLLDAVALLVAVALAESLSIARPMPAAATQTSANARDTALQTAGRRAKRRMAVEEKRRVENCGKPKRG